MLAATIKYHIRKYKQERSEAYEMLNSSLYVDDLFYGANTVNEVLDLSSSAIEILKDANMNLRKFKTNFEELRNLWYERGMIEVEDSSVRPLKVLGIIWNTKDDMFKLEVQPILNMIEDLKNSKQSVLQTASKIFDPVGFVSLFNLIIKCLLQEIWENGLGWDDELPTELKKRWGIWYSQIYLLKDLTFERKCFSFPLNQAKELELHIFSDASPRTFGAVSYFRYVSYDGRISTSFITAKSRVAPLKKLTLPRLELMGAVIAARILRYLTVNLNFPISRVYLWSDSLISLHWIKGAASKWKPFVSNRVIEIQSNTDLANWHHCSGKDNPADYISRGASAERLMNSSIWIHGPEWLRQKEENWPKGSDCKFSPGESGERRIIQDEIQIFSVKLDRTQRLYLI
ncbi:hypothetical protein AVEN_29148-1 [Araneus ventricosus]|uniref:Reverse transcriptase domain-containing protein n=1 Tax=Araneus ventricosus TaxID=182803 RepID=A0A4Y2ALM3_ARAVE|nr:hypothetical protein AVEN_29148-1 [Araneus ventricosus]